MIAPNDQFEIAKRLSVSDLQAYEEFKFITGTELDSVTAPTALQTTTLPTYIGFVPTDTQTSIAFLNNGTYGYQAKIALYTMIFRKYYLIQAIKPAVNVGFVDTADVNVNRLAAELCYKIPSQGSFLPEFKLWCKANAYLSSHCMHVANNTASMIITDKTILAVGNTFEELVPTAYKITVLYYNPTVDRYVDGSTGYNAVTYTTDDPTRPLEYTVKEADFFANVVGTKLC